MAGGSRRRHDHYHTTRHAAMEPRPDGRGKLPITMHPATEAILPQWSPGLMAGGSGTTAPAGPTPAPSRNGAPA